jgi:hypothetical protein
MVALERTVPASVKALHRIRFGVSLKADCLNTELVSTSRVRTLRRNRTCMNMDESIPRRKRELKRSNDLIAVVPVRTLEEADS